MQFYQLDAKSKMTARSRPTELVFARTMHWAEFYEMLTAALTQYSPLAVIRRFQGGFLGTSCSRTTVSGRISTTVYKNWVVDLIGTNIPYNPYMVR